MSSTLAFGKALYDRRAALGLSVADLAGRAGMTADEIECIEEGGTEPTVALLRRLAAALDADVRPHRRPRPRLRLVRNPRRLTHPVRVLHRASQGQFAHSCKIRFTQTLGGMSSKRIRSVFAEICR
jgi:transcriptional regulator with XRE-family HTH domain